MSDQVIKWVEAVRSGKIETLSKLINHYQVGLERYLRHLIGNNPDQIEDLLQEVWIGAYIGLNSYDKRQKFDSWVYRIAHNKAVDWLRKKRPIVTIDKTVADDWVELIVDLREQPEEAAIRADDRERLTRAMARLNDEEREVVVLYYVEDKNYEEIGEVIRKPKSYVGVKLMRTRDKLKKYLIQDE